MFFICPRNPSLPQGEDKDLYNYLQKYPQISKWSIKDVFLHIYKTFHSKIDYEFSNMNFKINNSIQEYIIKNRSIRKQHAIAIFIGKDDSELNLGPYYEVKKKKIRIHSEDKLIDELINLIQTKEIDKYSEIWIYSYNSPCTGRKHRQPCMYNLISIAENLSRTKSIKIYIGFTKFYTFNKNIAATIKGHEELIDLWEEIKKI